jgi:diguanylate cyclase (GGDEF)-like protein
MNLLHLYSPGQGLADSTSQFGAMLKAAWSSTSFARDELAAYAAPDIVRETRHGVALLSAAALAFLAVAALFSSLFKLGESYTYTYAVLAALALHVRISATRVSQVRALNLLAMLLLVVSGSSLVLLARQAGQLHLVLLLSVAVLLMLVPMVPWGLREALATSGAIYLMFTSLTFFSKLRFAQVDLWALQCLMLMAATIALALVTRALKLRKHDFEMRFGLEQAHRKMETLANCDHLTGAWNRRYLELNFDRAVACHHRAGIASHFGLFDIDRFKQLNDTHGHRHGDCVLQAVRHAFAALDGEGECLVRLGGDEFAFLIAGPDAERRIGEAVAAIGPLARSTCPAEVAPTVSIGLIALPAEAPLTLEQAYARADSLLYEVKRAGGNGVRQALRVPA